MTNSVIKLLRDSLRMYGSIDSLPEAIMAPDWGAWDHYHDWRAYVPGAIQNAWNAMSNEARVVAYLMAQEQRDSQV